MIKIKLKDLLVENDVNISELSEATGLARSTITPLVNKPEEVKGLKIETINLICDYFGVSIAELLEFIPEKAKYSIVNYWNIPSKRTIHFALLKKALGNAERFILLFISTEQVAMSEEQTLNEYKSSIFLMGKEEINKIPSSIVEKIDSDKLMTKNIFLQDFKRQNNANRVALSKLLARFLLKNDQMAKFEVERIVISWEDFPLFEKIKHIFSTLNGEIEPLDLDVHDNLIFNRVLLEAYLDDIEEH